MRFVSNLLASIIVLGNVWTEARHLLEARSRELNTTAALALPQCVTQCATRVLADLNCPILDPTTSLTSECYCASKGPVADGLSTCVLEECPTLAEALEGLKFQADSCEYPRDRNRGTLVLVVALVLFSITTLFLIARFLSRWRRLSGAGLSWDDAVVMACYIPVVGITVVACKMVEFGGGQDSWMLPITDIISYAKWFYAVQSIYMVAVFCTKLSLVFLYLRIWPSEPGYISRFRIICWAIAIALVSTALACVLSIVFACHPISNAWKYANTAMGTCTNRVHAAYAYGGLNVMFDIIVIVLPIPRLLKLDVSVGQKLGICSCFLVGFIATACSIIRLTQLNGLYTARNITWDFTPAGFWSLIEVYCSMICCCMVPMTGLIQRCWHRGRQTMNGSQRLPSFEMVTASEKDRGSGTFLDMDKEGMDSPTMLISSAARPWESKQEFVKYMPTARLPPER
ncbi:hypothetical protein Slin15195_G121260 [Septoria linicola]|uniref:Rhodopsin domain-containing protein n=1 Tax=Septoria linicola TaxID=215465 RepID=A0A9Q9AZD9_9PEZI|nr:hypothetical protein Slin15195_G121260 [Septoria linicola]